ncbi:MAG TPA: hypothetical protein VMT19_09800 [Thermoanaerobaculaceae bacterium]|nr:hypothetical protein [Thermoanaerobaculaceae bacterium]
MRRKYSIALAVALAAATAAAAPCPTALTEIAGRVAGLRQVPPPFTPPCRLVSQEELRALLDRKLRRDLPIAPNLYLESLVRTGFIEGDPGAVWDHLLAFYTSQVLGFYEPQADEMIVVDSPATARLEGGLVWAHELAHAAQEHRFHLPSRLLAMRGDGDRQRAASAVAEGEAMLVMFVLRGGAEGVDELDAAEATVAQQAKALPPPPGVPAYFVADLVFPYTAGFSAALRAYRSGGWTAVDRLLANPPTSTSALLHPDAPAAKGVVPAADLPPVPEGWQEVLTDTVGEWGLAFLLGRRAGTAHAEAAAAGWDGDRMRLIRNAANPGRWALAWRLQCRSVAAREQLERAMQESLPPVLARLDGGERPQLTWVAAGRTVELRAAWPRPSPSR